MWPLAVTVACLVAIGVGGFLYFTKMEMRGALKEVSAASPPVTVNAFASGNFSSNSNSGFNSICRSDDGSTIPAAAAAPVGRKVCR
jgi:hypothetical protein